MNGLFVLARKASDMKIVTTKHGDAAVRFRGRYRQTISERTNEMLFIFDNCSHNFGTVRAFYYQNLIGKRLNV